jgi:hypothetical protein
MSSVMNCEVFMPGNMAVRSSTLETFRIGVVRCKV